MQIQTLKRLIVLSVLGVLAAISAQAQSGNQFTVTIPFDFYVGGKTLTASGWVPFSRAQATTQSSTQDHLDY